MTAFTDEEETAFGFGDKAPWLLETRLRENGADFEGGPAFAPTVVIDGNLITGQNPASAAALGRGGRRVPHRPRRLSRASTTVCAT